MPHSINELIELIIPPADYQHRNGFNNIPILQNLSLEEKHLVEDRLIEVVKEMCQRQIENADNVDLLIIETLVVLKSKKVLPDFYQLLEQCMDTRVKNRNVTVIVLATAIFQLNNDGNMETIVEKDFSGVASKFQKFALFYDLIKFKSEKLNAIISAYINHPDFLLSYHAKRCLEKEFNEKTL